MIFNEDEILNESERVSIIEWCEKHLVGFMESRRENCVDAFLEIKRPGGFFIQYKDSLFKDCYRIPIFYSWLTDSNILRINCLERKDIRGRKLIIYDYNGDNIDWLKLSLNIYPEHDIIAINCPNLHNYRGIEFFCETNAEILLL